MRRPADPASALQQVLAAEHAAVYGYGVVGAHLGGQLRARATADWVAHQEARDRLEAMLRSLGVSPVPAAVAYRLPRAVRTPGEAVLLGLLLEERLATAYLGLVADPGPAIRQMAALQVRACALRAASWRGGTVAFPGLAAADLAPGRRHPAAGGTSVNRGLPEPAG